ncbi:glutamine synthetase family protein [Granulosicoccaceae sp. 1_MG-2023]|nr:glutamine synthetase family protein [Granulosicoccaceae sp. 1_MG-2023]
MPLPDSPAQELRKAQALLASCADVSRIEMMIPDINAVLRGKWLPVDGLDSAYREGVRLAGSVFALDLWGTEVMASGMISHNGDPDAVCYPVPDGLQLCHWMEPPAAQLLVSMYNMDGSPFFADPSHILAALVRQLQQAHQLTPVVAIELEFHLLDKAADPQQAQESTHAEVYSLQELERYRPLFDEIESVCRQQGIPSDSIITEAGANQFEINLHHQPDAVQACRDAILLKRVIKALADKHGLIASFMAKPFANDAGNGLHANLSLIDEQGRNVFCSPGPGGSALMQSAIAGLLDIMAESTLLFAPHGNSYRRFAPESHAPTAICWGVDNRNVAIRLPRDAGPAMRLEHRVAGADANPFLVLAGILAGILHGLDASPAIPGPEQAIPDPDEFDSVPCHWDQAIALFRESRVLRKALGGRFCDLYIHTKEQELATLRSRISDVEYERYFLQS